jgi:hypothetical protein
VTEFVAADVLASWAGGLAAAGAAVATWRVVGPGFLWLVAGTSALFGLPALVIETDVAAALAVAALVAASIVARRPRKSALALAVAAILFVVAGTGTGVARAVTAALFLGGVSAEMLLGHWYLVDPRLPRRALFRLDAAAGAGLLAEIVVLAVSGVFGWAEGDTILGVTFVTMAAATAVLLIAVWFALREPAYPAVMAATGLSYLAVLTAVGTSVVGRVVLEGAAAGGP